MTTPKTSKPRKPRKDGPRNCRGVKFTTGSDRSALFWDKDGNPVPTSQVKREVAEGYRYFCSRHPKFQPPKSYFS